MGVIDNITGIKVIKPRHEESVRVRFDVTFTFVMLSIIDGKPMSSPPF